MNTVTVKRGEENILLQGCSSTVMKASFKHFDVHVG